MREDKVMKPQQQGIAVPNPYSVKRAKPLITEDYNNRMELNKLKRGFILPSNSCHLDIRNLVKKR